MQEGRGGGGRVGKNGRVPERDGLKNGKEKASDFSDGPALTYGQALLV